MARDSAPVGQPSRFATVLGSKKETHTSSRFSARVASHMFGMAQAQEGEIPLGVSLPDGRPTMPKKTRMRHVAVPEIDQALSYSRRPFVYIHAEPAQTIASFG